MGLFETGRATNSIVYTGKLYDFDITMREGKSGYMAFGSLDLAISEDASTVVKLRFFANSLTKAGAPNKLFVQLLEILKNGATIADRSDKDTAFEIQKKIQVASLAQEITASLGVKPRLTGVDVAPVWRAGASFETNLFINQQDEEVVSVERKLGFLQLSKDGSLGSSFEADVYLTAVAPKLDADGNETGDVNLKGLTFDFRDAVVPVNFRASGEGALDYFTSLMDSEETRMVKLNGYEFSQVIEKTSGDAPSTSGWGKVVARTTKFYDKAFLVEGAAENTKPWSEEELKKAVAQYKIDKDQKAADARARKAAPKAPAAAPIASPASAVETVDSNSPIFNF